MSSEKPLGFQWQFAAGAIAGVSEILVMFVLPLAPVCVRSTAPDPNLTPDPHPGTR
ncbi:putative mitochondrial 2-oxoglutarate 2-oxoadipate transporter-like protein [Rosellinia necatrix]|uniref:Putative mitochondrial 2-oxoglutarate 2-oxoadipate transporter-like protein n=1 Tax=Rosellinia necatrix TaxID=77044 RepID=A0A1S8A941_ROSNE|nr:putative mitochondrial 2-oxoglutarate 2-oxoadipate transporter-like protein [Rosellinia necatrix]